MQDDSLLTVVKRDLSGGINTRQHEQIIVDNQATVLQNIILDTAGQRSGRAGATLIETFSTSASTGLFGFEPENGTDELLVLNGKNLWYSSTIVSAGFTSATAATFTTSLSTTMIKALESDEADVVIVANGTDHCFRMTQAHGWQDLNDGSTSPPLTTVYTWFRDRLWALKDNKLYYSGAIPVDFSVSFDRSLNYYNIPIGTEKALLGIRDTGILVGGTDAIWGVNPTITPAPATDKPEKLLDIGLIAPLMIQVGDDAWFLASDGVRGLFRSQQDKLQGGSQFPLSWNIKDEIDAINWTQAKTKADGVFFDNKFLITFPSGTSTYNNRIAVAYPALRDSQGLPAWVVFTGLNIARFSKINVSGEERLYGIDATNGNVYRLMNGTSDNATAIVIQEESRAEDFGKPLQKKYGGEFKIKLVGGTKSGDGTLEVFANADDRGYYRLGTITISDTGVTYPATFPITFVEGNELEEQFHLDIPNVGQFKRIKFKIYCNSLDASITILESIVTTFLEEYQSED